MVVEDDHEQQEFIAVALAKLGHELHFVDNGREAVRKAPQIHPHAYLVDLNLPQMNGIEVIKSLKSMGLLDASPCVVMTALTDVGGVLHSAATAMGAMQFLHKPFSADDLVDTVNLAFQQRCGAPETPEVKKGTIRLDPRFRRVWIREKFVGYLSPKRFQILMALARTQGPVGREMLLRSVWGAAEELNTVDKTIQRLREDLGPEGLRRILTTPGGYELLG